MNEETVPDLYRLAFMPGAFRCPTCGFQWSKQTISPGGIGTTEADRESDPCPNDGTPMVHVTYREQLEAYATRLHEELDRNDELFGALEKIVEKYRDTINQELLYPAVEALAKAGKWKL